MRMDPQPPVPVECLDLLAIQSAGNIKDIFFDISITDSFDIHSERKGAKPPASVVSREAEKDGSSKCKDYLKQVIKYLLEHLY